MFRNHVLALLIGTILDFFIGDPETIWHPARIIEEWVMGLDRFFLGEEGLVLAPEEDRNTLGLYLVLFVLIPVLVVMAVVTLLMYKISPFLGVLFEAVASCYCLAGRKFKQDTDQVLEGYFDKGVRGAAPALAKITDKDTDNLSIEETVKTTIEAVAKNGVSKVGGPLFYLFLFGPVGGMFYRAADIMNAKLSRHKERYEDFGYGAQKLWDYANYLPARLTGLLTLFAAKYSPVGVSYKNAKLIFMRDRNKNDKDVLNQNVAVFAGALGVKLGGNASYNGACTEEPFIGDDDKPVEIKDVRRALDLLLHIFFDCQIILLIFLILL